MALSFYPEGTRILPSDDELRTLHKIASLNGAGSGGSPGSGGGGTGQVYRDRDPAAPDNPAMAAISYSSTTGVITQWNTGTASWN